MGDDNTVNVHVSNLRSKLSKVDKDNEYIQTVWGIGFSLRINNYINRIIFTYELYVNVEFISRSIEEVI